MARILAISSFVASGTVGLRVIVPALEGMGHDVLALPSVVLSSHAGYARRWGLELPAADLDGMAAAMADNGWLANLDAVLTGYLPSVALIGSAARLVDAVRRRNARAIFVCDPVLGDWPKGLFIPADAARALREELVPRADATTPNVFELSWLTGLPTSSLDEVAAAARGLGARDVFATSVPVAAGQIATALITRNSIATAAFHKVDRVPHGAGDLMAAYLTGYLAAGSEPANALTLASRQLNAVIAASAGREDLALPHVLRRSEGRQN